LNHGFFKALLFLSAGSIIHALSDEQDLRRMGGLISFLPITFSVFLIGSLSLIGFPFLTGFYSKDLILEGVWSFQSPFSTYGYLLALISALLTAFYSTRALFLTFLSLPNYLSSKAPDSSVSLKTMKIHESSPGILCALIFLALASIFMGYLTKEMLTGIGTPF
jgi:NADH-ubiquinone oxidoreductase chain 5